MNRTEILNSRIKTRTRSSEPRSTNIFGAPHSPTCWLFTLTFAIIFSLWEIGILMYANYTYAANRVPTVLEKYLNFGVSLKSPWKWICPWKVLEFRGPSLKFQLVVLDFLFCVFWTESLNGYSKLRGTRANFSQKKIRLASFAAAYKLDIFPVPLAHI